ncbi:MAG: RsmB/NOP family class I SAM-dependent RNA methyltransferase [Magnetococcales bacterium]|nr:RsmB/NOP family class I SAM-dependent RNA methyltransferase [Magnetococcales bacterium]
MTQELAITLAAALLEEIFDHSTPADGALRRLFQRRNSGSVERARIGDLVFAVLRHRRFLERQAERLATPETARLVTLVSLAAAGMGERSLFPELPALPEWLWQALVAQYGVSTAHALDQALTRPAPTDLRVNRQKIERAALQKQLAARDIVTTPLPNTPDGLRLHGNPPVTTLDLFHQGLFEIQDEGSQWIAPLLAPRPGETIVDLCAGGGGKTLHLATLLGRRGQIIATDTDAKRLGQLNQRLRRVPGHRVRVLPPLRHEGDPALKPYVGKVDAVLVDAPCSGTGTLRRRPDLMWHLAPEQIPLFHERQCGLLAAAARLLRPGGRLVYATCSLLARENQAVIETFLNENPNFRLLSAMPTLAARGFGEIYSMDPYLTLLPHIAGCDGFFAALLQRNR